MHESLSLVAIPLPGVLLVGLCFWLVCCCFWVLFCVFGFLAVIAYWTAYRSITSTFGAIDYWQPCTIISIHLLIRSNVSNDLAEAMKALDGKKDSCTVTAQWIMCRSISVLLYHIVIITSCPIGTACPYWNRTSCAAPHGQINCPAGHCARWRNWKRVGHRSWRRGQTAVGGSIPRWSASKPQVVTRQKAKGARPKKKNEEIESVPETSEASQKFRLCCYCPVPKFGRALRQPTGPYSRGCPSRALELSSTLKIDKAHGTLSGPERR